MSARRRGATGLSGILAVDKPAGITSHDVVARIRRATGEGRVGHAGTLDPMATGVLVVLVGPAARLAPYLTSATKSYRASITFGSATDTDDAEGRVIREASVPPHVLDVGFATDTIKGLTGTHEQVPPAFSAIKRDGVVAYKAAREGDALSLEPRRIEVEATSLVSVEPPATWVVDLTVSKGTYIRAIARDLGTSLGSAAHLTALTRTTSGMLDIARAHDLETLTDRTHVEAAFLDPVRATGLRVIEGDIAEVATGRPLAIPSGIEVTRTERVAIASGRTLLAVYRENGGRLTAEAVFPGGIEGGDR